MSRAQRSAHEAAMVIATLYGGLGLGSSMVPFEPSPPGRGVNVRLAPPKPPRERSSEEKFEKKCRRQLKMDRKKKRGF